MIHPKDTICGRVARRDVLASFRRTLYKWHARSYFPWKTWEEAVVSWILAPQSGAAHPTSEHHLRQGRALELELHLVWALGNPAQHQGLDSP